MELGMSTLAAEIAPLLLASMSPENFHQLNRTSRFSDPHTFHKLVNEYWERLYIFAFKLTSNRELSQSIVQNVFIDLWEKRQPAEIIQLESYLFQAVKFQVFKAYRDNKMNVEILREKFEYYLAEHENEYEPELILRLHQAIDRLPDRCREIFHLNRFHEQSIDQIAEQLNLSRQTVKNQLSRAFQQVSAELRNN